MAAGDIIRNQGISIIEAGMPSWTPTSNQSRWAKEENSNNFYYYDGTSWKEISINFNSVYSGNILPDNNSDLSLHLQSLESAIENINIPIETVSDSDSIVLTITTNNLTANVKLDVSQDNYLEITESPSGLKITPQNLSSFASFSDAQLSSLLVGDAFLLTVNNLEGIPTDGITSPVFRKQ